MSKNVSRIVVSCVALIILLVRHIWPQFHIDTVDLALLALFLIPWLSNLIKEIEIPGFGKIGFQDVKAAGEKIGFAPSFATKQTLRAPDVSVVQQNDANLLIVGFRIEIEKRLHRLAEQNKIPSNTSLSNLIRKLAEIKVIQPSTSYGLLDFIHIGNKAAHGANIDPNAALWVREFGPKIIEYLDSMAK